MQWGGRSGFLIAIILVHSAETPLVCLYLDMEVSDKRKLERGEVLPCLSCLKLNSWQRDRESFGQEKTEASHKWLRGERALSFGHLPMSHDGKKYHVHSGTESAILNYESGDSESDDSNRAFPRSQLNIDKLRFRLAILSPFSAILV